MLIDSLQYSLRISQRSSNRYSAQGSQPQLPSRNATRSLGNRSSTPPAQKLPTANISSMGLRKALINTASLVWPLKRCTACSVIRARRRMKTDRHAKFFRFAPHRIVVAVVDMPAIGSARAPGTRPIAPNSLIARRVSSTARSTSCSVISADGRSRFGSALQKSAIQLFQARQSVIGILGLQTIVAVQRKSPEQHRDVQALVVHRRQLRHGVVVARQRFGIPMRHLSFSRRAFAAISLGGGRG